VVIEAALRDASGKETDFVFGLIDAAWVSPTRGVDVRMSQEMAHQAVTNALTYLHSPTQAAIAADDLIAERIWEFLEAETFRFPMRYPILPSLKGPAYMPPIAELLQLADSNERRVVRRITRAAEVIRRNDPAYGALAVVRGRGGVAYLLAFREGVRRPSVGQLRADLGVFDVRARSQKRPPRRISVDKTVVRRNATSKPLEPLSSVLENLIAGGLKPDLVAAFGRRKRRK
jgi:hypothetical protein